MANEKTKKFYDWGALKLEWLNTDLTLNQFREKKGIDTAHFYRSINAEQWHDARQDIYKKALNKLQERKSTQLASRYDDYLKLWGAVKVQAARILKDAHDQNDPLKPSQLAQLTQAIETALKSEKLILGESTENVAHNVNLRNAIIEDIRKSNADPNKVSKESLEKYGNPDRSQGQDLEDESSLPNQNQKSGNFDFQIQPHSV